MTVELPFEPLTPARIQSNTTRDQRVELSALDPAEVTVADEPAARAAEDADQRSDPLDPLALDQRVGARLAKLLVKDRQIDHGPRLFPARRNASGVCGEHSGSPLCSPPLRWLRVDALARTRELLDNGDPIEEVVRKLRGEGFRMIESMSAVAKAGGLSHDDAKTAVLDSPVWADQRDRVVTRRWVDPPECPDRDAAERLREACSEDPRIEAVWVTGSEMTRHDGSSDVNTALAIVLDPPETVHSGRRERRNHHNARCRLADDGSLSGLPLGEPGDGRSRGEALRRDLLETLEPLHLRGTFRNARAAERAASRRYNSASSIRS